MANGPIEITVLGAHEFHQAARACHRMADNDLDNHIARELREVSKPITEAVRTEIPRKLPSGYAPTLVRSFRAEANVDQSGHRTTLKLRGRARGKIEDRDVRAMDRGLLRHPVFGNRANWASQHIRPGFFSDPIKRSEKKIREHLERAIKAAIDRVERKV